jgi:hypothetical protein
MAEHVVDAGLALEARAIIAYSGLDPIALMLDQRPPIAEMVENSTAGHALLLRDVAQECG